MKPHTATALPWHRQTGAVVIALVFLFPLGIALMWWNRLWSHRTRVTISAMTGLLVIVALAMPSPRRTGSTEPEPPVRPPSGDPEPNPPSVPSPGGTQPTAAAVTLPPLEKGVILNVDIHFDTQRKAVVSGTTNLPDGTALLVTVEEPRGFSTRGQSKTSVSGGRFRFEGIGPKGGLPDGEYMADVVVPAATSQPDMVRAVIGERGEKLTGDLIVTTQWGSIVQVESSAILGSKASGDRRRALVKEEAQRILAELRTLEQEGRSMEGIRNVDGLPHGPAKLKRLRRCDERMRDLQPKARRLRQRADDLPQTLSDLRVAATELDLCVSCLQSVAMQNCSRARDTLRAGTDAVAKLRP